MKQVKVVCNPDGTVQVEAIGFKGKGCTAATQFMEKALGIEDAKSKFKDEFYQQAVQEKQRIGGGK